MSKMRSLLSMYALAAIAYSDDRRPYDNTPQRENQNKDKPSVVPNGVKEFIYGETKIYAINQKNADRKAKKLKLI